MQFSLHQTHVGRVPSDTETENVFNVPQNVQALFLTQEQCIELARCSLFTSCVVKRWTNTEMQVPILLDILLSEGRS